jgi:hypothetical protein
MVGTMFWLSKVSCSKENHVIFIELSSRIIQ